MDATPRKKIYKRDEQRKHVKLLARDIRLFELLNRHYALRSNFIEAFIGGNSIALRFRLRDLYDAQYLQRPVQQFDTFNARSLPLVYMLDARGETVLKQLGLYRQTRPGRNSPHHQFDHDLMVSDVLASIELGVLESGFEFITASEILERAPQATREASHPFKLGVGKQAVIPDAVFGVRRPGRSDFFCLEADRENEPLVRQGEGTSYMKKLAIYRSYIEGKHYREQFEFPNLRLLNVTLSHSHLRNMIEKAGSATYFLYKSEPRLAEMGKAPNPMPGLFSEPWLQSGGSLISL